MIVNWKTTLAGLLGFLAVLFPELVEYIDDNPDTVPDWNVVAAALTVFVGLIFARDADKTSEDQRH